jgi:hypothetical protein
MIISPDILHAIADWARVAEARVTGIDAYPHIGCVTVEVDFAAFQRAFAGATVELVRATPDRNYDRYTSPDMGGWRARTTKHPANAPVVPSAERVTL